ncbi:MAG: DUF4824 family protein [Acidobacteria bacterium]|nr:DUF4824 family protein [Acidobacteriota bacterium]
MIRRGHIVALVLVLACNLAVLVQVAGDRRDPSNAEIWLTERELPLAAREQESSLLLLELAWSGEGGAEGVGAVGTGGDEALLRGLGFDCSMPAEREEAGLFYDAQLPRAAWVALEYEGAAWRAWQQRERDAFASRASTAGAAGETREAMESRLEHASRLVLVDADAARSELLRRYPDRERVLLLPAHVGPSLRRDEGRGRRLVAVILWDGGGQVVVPRSLREPLAGLAERPRDRGGKPKEYLPPRYRALLVQGRRDLLRLAAVEPLAER